MNRVIDGCNFLFRDSLYASLVLQVTSLQVLAQRMDQEEELQFTKLRTHKEGPKSLKTFAFTLGYVLKVYILVP